MRDNQPIINFNRGIVSRLGMARGDVPRLRLAAETQTNWLPRVLGSMMLRPGLEYTSHTHNDAFARCIAYVREVDVYARLELTDSVLRILVDDAVIERPAVTAAVTNGTFDTDISGWTDADESGAASSWQTGGLALLLGDGTNFAILRQEVTVNEANTEHALRIVISRGPVMLRVGSASAGEQYIAETALGTGTHSLAFTPTGNFHIQISSSRLHAVLVDSIEVEAEGAVELPTPWDVDDIPLLRHTISGDVIYLAGASKQQRKIERRGTRSWSIVLYEPETGPFRLQNTSNTTLTPGALTGDTTLTASKGIFRSTHVGALFRIASIGQSVTSALSAENTFSDPIRVTGIDEGRRFSIIIEGTFVATVTVQYSIGEPGSWVDLATTYAAPTSTTHDDGLDNQIVYYRIGIKTGDYTSGTANVTLGYAAGSISGIARVTEFTSSTQVNCAVLKAFGATSASSDWWEGEWSDYRGWPSAIALQEGRMFFAGLDKMWGSISGLYEDFDDEVEGDSGPISRSIGEGPIQTIHWLLPLGRLLLGTALNSANVPSAKIDGNNVLAVRSSSFDEPLTPTNFSLKNTAVRGVYVDRSEQRLIELAYAIEANDYESRDLSVLVPDLNSVGIAGIAVQHKPDVRIHCWRTDGTVGCLVFDSTEGVTCWVEFETDGVVEDVTVLPGAIEDRVYYVVSRTINSATVRFHEKMAMEIECDGQPSAHHADCHLRYAGAATTTISGLGHLEGETVVVWGWNTATPFTVTDEDGTTREVGRDFGTFTVSGGQISGLSAAVTNACVGLAYTAEFKSSKHAFSDALGPLLNHMKRIVNIGLVLLDTHYQGLKYGGTLVNADMYDLTKAERITTTDTSMVWEEVETRPLPLLGKWDTDSRLCLRAAAPRPCTVAAVTVGIESNSK